MSPAVGTISLPNAGGDAQAAPAPPAFYCPGCGARYFAPGVCVNQHESLALERDAAVAYDFDGNAGSGDVADLDGLGTSGGGSASDAEPVEIGGQPRTIPPAAVEIARLFDAFARETAARLDAAITEIEQLLRNVTEGAGK